MRKEPELSPSYRKDPEYERFLDKLNAILAPRQEEDYQDLPETYPTLHVIGAPRSGTTLLTQLIASHLNVGYVNNLIAAFWRAPVYGIRLSKKLLPRRLPSSYMSDFGRTYGIHEPHEYGYFWSSLLGYEEMLQQDDSFEQRIDWQRVRLVLTNMTHAFGGPVVFKSVLLGWHVARMQEILRKSYFARIRREPTQNAISLLRTRKEFLGSAEKWFSMKPAEYGWLKNEPYWRQVAGQVYYVEKSVTEQIQESGGHNVLEVTYEELCQDPRGILRQVKELLERNGGKVDYLSQPPQSFKASVKDVGSTEEHRLIDAAVKEFYGCQPRGEGRSAITWENGVSGSTAASSTG